MDYDVTFDREEGRRLAVASYDARAEEIGERIGPALESVARHCARHGVTVASPAVSCYEMRGDGFHLSSGFFVEQELEPGEDVATMRLPAVETATTTHLGSYDRLVDAYEALKSAAREQGREVDEDAMMWEEYWTGPEAPVEEWRTVVHWPLVPASA